MKRPILKLKPPKRPENKRHRDFTREIPKILRRKNKDYKPTVFPKWLPENVREFITQYEANIYQAFSDYKSFTSKAAEMAAKKKSWHEAPFPKYRASVELEAQELLHICKEVLPVYCDEGMAKVWIKLDKLNSKATLQLSEFIILTLHRYRNSLASLVRLEEREALIEQTKQRILNFETERSALAGNIQEIEMHRLSHFGQFWCDTFLNGIDFKPLLEHLDQQQQELVAQNKEIANPPELAPIFNRKFRSKTGRKAYFVRNLHGFMKENYGDDFHSYIARFVSLIFKENCSDNNILKIVRVPKR